MKVLFVGGTGVISSASSALALKQGIDLYLLNRGQSARPIPPGARVLNADIRDPKSTRAALAGHNFDVVVNWINYSADHIEADLDLFRGRTGQYIFISSASAYQTPPTFQPITESTPLDNPAWQYSRDKIACEERLVRAYREEKFPITIVRPSHTYDCTYIPLRGRWSVVDRMLRGKKVIVHGDGTSLWTLTHHADFARGFVGLMGNAHAIGEAVHITSDELLTWNQVFEQIAAAAGTHADMVHIPSDLIAAYVPEWGEGLRGDKMHSRIFDNTKIKRLVPGFTAAISFAQGMREAIAWFRADSARQKVDALFDQDCDTILAGYRAAWPVKSNS